MTGQDRLKELLRQVLDGKPEVSDATIPRYAEALEAEVLTLWDQRVALAEACRAAIACIEDVHECAFCLANAIDGSSHAEDCPYLLLQAALPPEAQPLAP